jgi:hypothetical protein
LGEALANNGMQRKLRAIFSADVNGYSKLMGEDDEHQQLNPLVFN